MFLLIFALLAIFLTNYLIDTHGGIQPFPKINRPYEIVTHKVFIDISIENRPAKRLHLVLFGNTMPKMVENFRALCTGEKGVNKDGVRLHYKGTFIKKVQRFTFIEGGDLLNNTNLVGVSIYDKAFFADNYNLGHNGLGYLGMRQGNLSESSNHKFTSIFYIITRKLDYYDNVNAVFGKMLYESERIWLRNELRYIGTEMGHNQWYHGNTIINVPSIEIVDSGELPLDGTETEMLNPDYYKKVDL